MGVYWDSGLVVLVVVIGYFVCIGVVLVGLGVSLHAVIVHVGHAGMFVGHPNSYIYKINATSQFGLFVDTLDPFLDLQHVLESLPLLMGPIAIVYHQGRQVLDGYLLGHLTLVVVNSHEMPVVLPYAPEVLEFHEQGLHGPDVAPVYVDQNCGFPGALSRAAVLLLDCD